MEVRTSVPGLARRGVGPKRSRADTLTQTCPPGDARAVALIAHVSLEQLQWSVHPTELLSTDRQRPCQPGREGSKRETASETDHPGRQPVWQCVLGCGRATSCVSSSPTGEPVKWASGAATREGSAQTERLGRRGRAGALHLPWISTEPNPEPYALRPEAQASQDRHSQAEEAASQEPPQEEEPLVGSGRAVRLGEAALAASVASRRIRLWRWALAILRAPLTHPSP